MNKKVQKVADHIKESMCIDGTVEFITYNELGHLIEDSNEDLIVLKGAIFECNDSKRGQFFIGWYIPENIDNNE